MRLLPTSLVAALALLLAGGGWRALAAFVANAQQWLPYPYPRPGSEGLMLYETVLLRAGGDLYGPITPERFISGPYPPVYYWLAGRIMPATPGFFDGRSLSLWAALAVAAFIIIIVAADRRGARAAPTPTPSPEGGGEIPSRSPSPFRRGGWGVRSVAVPLAAGVAAAGLWLACPPVLIWSTRFRADMLMMACQAAGLACLVLGAPASTPTPHPSPTKGGELDVLSPSPFRKGGRGVRAGNPQSAIRNPQSALVWLAIPCFVLALYTKQTALAGPLGGALWLLARDWRQGLRWIGALGALGGGLFLALDLATGHGFYGKMVVYHSLPWSTPTFTRLLTAWAEGHWPLIAVALGYLAWAAWTRRNSPIVWYIAAAFATLPTAGVVGADHNHLLAVDLALVLATGSVLAGGPWAVVSRQSSVVSRQSSVGGRRSAVVSRRLAVGGWRSAVGGRRSSVGGWRLAVGGRRSAVVSRQSAVVSNTFHFTLFTFHYRNAELTP